MVTPRTERKHISKKERARRIFDLLGQRYPDARTGLSHENPFQLFVATVLSAQTTDEQVNSITAKLFKAAPSPREMAAMQPSELEPYLRKCGLFRHKSRYLVEACRILEKHHGGRLPDRFEELVKLPGVGRKTANVILSSAFGYPALAVDTHVYRVSRRLGLAIGPGTMEVEEQLKRLLPPGEWPPAHHRLIAHGRETCKARKPGCQTCFLKELCEHGREQRSEVRSQNNRKQNAE